MHWNQFDLLGPLLRDSWRYVLHKSRSATHVTRWQRELWLSTFRWAASRMGGTARRVLRGCGLSLLTAGGVVSRRRDCYFTDTPPSIHVKTPTVLKIDADRGAAE